LAGWIDARGRQIDRQSTLENLLQQRFGNLDETMTALIPTLVELPLSEYSQLLFALPSISREDLLDRFQ
jgi:hypothetical protein